MSRYWDDETVYSQPSAAELKAKAKESVKGPGKRAKPTSLRYAGQREEQSVRAGGDRHGV